MSSVTHKHYANLASMIDELKLSARIRIPDQVDTHTNGGAAILRMYKKVCVKYVEIYVNNKKKSRHSEIISISALFSSRC